MITQCELNQGDTNEDAKLDGENTRSPQPYTKNYKQLSKAGSRIVLPQEKAYQIFV